MAGRDTHVCGGPDAARGSGIASTICSTARLFRRVRPARERCSNAGQAYFIGRRCFRGASWLDCPMNSDQFERPHYGIVALYFGAMIWLGLRFKRNAAGTDYFLGSRALGGSRWVCPPWRPNCPPSVSFRPGLRRLAQWWRDAMADVRARRAAGNVPLMALIGPCCAGRAS